MAELLKLMCVLAHPDDESLGVGSTLAKYAAEGIQTYVLTATRGERGWNGPEDEFPGLDALGKVREAELRAACAELKVLRLDLLDYVDGDLDQAHPSVITGQIAASFRKVRPQVVITFGPDGAYGHPDHIAISQFTTAAVLAAADPTYPPANDYPPHRVSKLYYMTINQEEADSYLPVFGDMSMPVDGIDRLPVIWPDWASTTVIDGSDYWQAVQRAVLCHQSQVNGVAENFLHLDEKKSRTLWGCRTYYRVFSLVNSGRELETDLFAGLR